MSRPPEVTPYFNPIQADVERRIVLGWGRRPGSCLDLGGGFGRITQAVEPFFSDIVLADVSNESTKLAKGRLRGTSIVRSDAAHIPARDSTFDCVLMLKVIHLLPNPTRVLSEILRVTKDSGTVIMSIPNPMTNHLVRQLGSLIPFVRWLIPTFSPQVWPLGAAPYLRPHHSFVPASFQLEKRSGTGIFDNHIGRGLSRLRFLHLVDVATASLWFLKLEVLYNFTVSK